MQNQCRGSESSEANSGGTVIEQRCVTDDSSSVSYPARMRIYARDEQHNFQHTLLWEFGLLGARARYFATFRRGDWSDGIEDTLAMIVGNYIKLLYFSLVICRISYQSLAYPFDMSTQYQSVLHYGRGE